MDEYDTQLISSYWEAINNISSQVALTPETSLLLSRMIVKKIRYGVSYDANTEEFIQYVLNLLQQ